MNKGGIHLILGPMFSGKTTELIRRIKRSETAHQKSMIIKYAKDNRYHDGDCIATHDNNYYSATVKTSLLSDVEYLAHNYSVIGIDEGQFYKDIVEFCEKMANMGKLVIVAALDGTFQRKGFPEILNLIPLSEQIVKLSAVCMMCYGDAAFSKRLTSDTQVELIGGKDSYLAVCRSCYHNKPVASPGKIKLATINNENVQSTRVNKISLFQDMTNCSVVN